MTSIRSLALRFFPVAVLLLLLSVLVPASRAGADTIEDFATLLDKVQVSGYKPSWLPITGNDVRQSRDLIGCIDGAHNDLDAVTCIDDYRNTPIGQKISQESEIPSWFWDLMETYIAYRTGDYWGVVAKLGEAAICIIAQVMTSGAVDVCGVIEELIAMGKELLDAAKAVAQFFKSLGEGAWEAAKGVGCAIGLGGCDDDSSPPEVVVYNWVFAPKISDGLTAIEALNYNDYPLLRKQLEANALANPAILSLPELNALYQSMGINLTFPQYAVTTASNIYDRAVVAQWKADMAKNVLPALAKQRDAYDSPQQVAALAGIALDAFKSNQGVAQAVKGRCMTDLRENYGFAHVDRWVLTYPQDAAGLGGVQTNSGWCSSRFWPNSKDEFAKHFRTYVSQHLCPVLGQSLMCASIDNYQSCLDLMGTVDHQGDCSINVAVAGKEAAEKIVTELKARGSTYTYQIEADSTLMSSTPVDLVVVRPSQQYYCKDIYQQRYGSLPRQLVNCKLKMAMPYALQIGLVKSEAARLSMKHQEPFVISPVDPMIVLAPSAQMLGAVKDDPEQTFVFQYFPLRAPLTVDGANAPGMVYQVELPVADKLIVGSLKDELIDFKAGGPDQWRQPTVDPGFDAAGRMNVGQVQIGREGMMAGALAGQAAGQQMQTMSGTLPPGSVPTGPGISGNLAKMGSTADPRPALQAQMVTPPGLPDLTADPQVTILGKRAAWGQTLTIDAGQAQQAVNGVCTFPVEYAIKNNGTGASGPFSSSWTNAVVPTPVTRNWSPVAAGARQAQKDLLSLKSGMNPLTLTVDQGNKVGETDENNNQFRLTLNVSGQCGRSQPAVMPQTSPGPKLLGR